ncbi:MAG: putative ABC transporter permease [Candidatus Ornithomonoglobus sp.]
MTLSQYFVCFIIYGFFGWIYESLYYSVQLRKPVNTGFLHVCFCPIYGFACVGNAVLFKNTENGVIIFVTSMLVISLMEYFVSWLLETLFGKRWWDYRELPFNINGRISLFSSLAFGAMSLVQMKLLHPSVAGFVTRLSEKYTYVTILLFMAVIILDLLLTIKDMDKEENKLWFVNEQLPILHNANEKLSEKVKLIADKYSDARSRIREKMGR